jgi:hypothetical protein
MMKHWMLSLTVACASLGLQAFAQSSSTATTQLDPQRGGNQTVLVTGCVARADTAHGPGSSTPGSSTPGTSTTPSSASSSPSSGTSSDYVLTNARMSNDSPTGTAQPSREDSRNTAGAAQTTAGTTATGTAMQIQLNSTSPDLRSYVGQRVEVTGRFETIPGLNASRSMRVESVRKVADTCQPS